MARGTDILTPEHRKLLIELGNKSPQQLRDILYDYVPETMEQIKRCYKKRGELIVRVFEEKIDERTARK